MELYLKKHGVKCHYNILRYRLSHAILQYGYNEESMYLIPYLLELYLLDHPSLFSFLDVPQVWKLFLSQSMTYYVDLMMLIPIQQ